MYWSGWALSCCDNKQSPNLSEPNRLILVHATGPLYVDGGGGGLFSSESFKGPD